MTITAPRQAADPRGAPPNAPPRLRRAGKLEASSATRTLVSAADLARPRTRALYYLALVVVTVAFVAAFLYPLYWLASSSVKSPTELADPVPTFWPHSFHPDVFVQAWTTYNIGHFFLNTVYYAFGGWLIQIVVDVLVAYSLSKLRPIFGKYVLGAMLSSLLLPATALLIPAYLTVEDVPLFHVNLLNTPWALWLPGAANAFNIYILKRFFDQIPGDILDSAAIDGAGRLRTLRSVVLPLSRPVLAVVSIMSVIGSWKDFLWPLVVFTIPDKATLSVAIYNLNFTGRVPANVYIAALAIASAPMIVIFLFFQRHILNGLGAGALKG